MSTSIEQNYYLETSTSSFEDDEFNIDEDDMYEKRCCEVFITFKRIMVFQCSLCDNRYRSFIRFFKHIMSQHFVEGRECDQVSDNTINAKSKKIPKSEESTINSDVKEHDCLKEEEIYFSENGITNKNPNPTNLTCDICGGIYKNNELLQLHLKTHIEVDRNRKDGKCTNETDNMSSLNCQGKRNKNQDACCQFDENSDVRNLPDASGKRGRALATRKHVDSNSEDNSLTISDEIRSLMRNKVGIYECNICHRTYEKYKQLAIHKRSHNSPDRKYKCEECGFAFKEKVVFNRHMERHNVRERKYCCTECDKKFFTLIDLKHHDYIHTKKRSCICATCGKTFMSPYHLTVHTRHHTGEKPHDCKVCGKGFRTNYELRNHLTVHVDLRTYGCSMCDAKFKRKKAQIQHMKIHANKREYVCNICPSRFNQKPALRSHLKNRHKIANLNDDDKEVNKVD